MLYTSTLLPATLDLLKKFMKLPVLDGFILVGGTAIALQLGHRISVDLDFFTSAPFNEVLLSEHLKAEHNFELDFITKHTIKGEINGVKVDYIAHQYAWIEPVIEEDGIRMAGLSDLSAMKLNAISNDGSRVKDFIDIAYLSGKLSLNSMLDAYVRKYNNNVIIPLKALYYYEDINFSEPIHMAAGKKSDWNTIEGRLKAIQNYPDKVFKMLN